MTTKIDEINKLGLICRICLKADGPMSSIFAPSETEIDHQPMLAAKITSIAQVQVNPGDGLPISICQSCHQQVEKFYDFRLLVEISDRALRSYLDETQRSKQISTKPIEDAKDLDYQEFLMESDSVDNPKDLFAVNTILVPSGGETQVWRICSVEGADEREKLEPRTKKKKTKVVPKLECPTQFANTSVDDVPGGKSTRSLKPVVLIKNVQDDEPFYFTTTTTTTTTTATTTNNEDREKVDSDPITCMTIIDDVNFEAEEELKLPLNKYSCQLCLKPFKTLRSLKSHVKDHFLGGKERIQICELDKRSAETTRKLLDFKSQEKQTDEYPEDEDPLICQKCDQVHEPSKDKRSQVVKSNGWKNVVRRDDNSCENCGGILIRRSRLRNDPAIHEDSSLTCTICKKNFRNAQSFKMHLKRHTLGSRYNCIECGKSYYSNSELARHTQLHTGTREYPCHLCHMSFFSKPELNRHSKYHRGEKKFQCKICLKSYYESGHLKVHERVHTGEKPFPCTVCEKAFITKSKLIRHLKIHERDRVP